MPIYEYECLACDKKFELRRSIIDGDNEIKCPQCGAENTHRVFSMFSAGSSGESCAPSSPT